MNDPAWEFLDGYADYFDGVPLDGNPYCAGSTESADWERGWEAAREDS